MPCRALRVDIVHPSSYSMRSAELRKRHAGTSTLSLPHLPERCGGSLFQIFLLSFFRRITCVIDIFNVHFTASNLAVLLQRRQRRCAFKVASWLLFAQGISGSCVALRSGTTFANNVSRLRARGCCAGAPSEPLHPTDSLRHRDLNSDLLVLEL